MVICSSEGTCKVGPSSHSYAIDKCRQFSIFLTNLYNPTCTNCHEAREVGWDVDIQILNAVQRILVAGDVQFPLSCASDSNRIHHTQMIHSQEVADCSFPPTFDLDNEEWYSVMWRCVTLTPDYSTPILDLFPPFVRA